MKTSFRFALAVVIGLAAGAAAIAGVKPFVSDKSKDYFGYYLPDATVKTGRYQLRNLFIGGKDEFVSFESGKADKAFAAVMAEFDDVTSPKKTGEDGQEFYTRTIRVLPTGYTVGNGIVHFAGTDKTLGAVVFDGKFEKDFFKKPTPDVPHPDDHPILKGKLTVGKQSFTVAFNWFGGD
ncbi:MAG: hypothetical protein WDN08_10095 [Rhizomicrobium sp.]